MDDDGEVVGGLGSYLVLTYSEAIAMAREDLMESFWDRNHDVADALINRPDIANVIDVERWAEDEIICQQANSGHGLGDLLSPCDSEEHEVILDGKAMFIYRVD